MAIPQDQNLAPRSTSLLNGRRLRILTVVDDFTRECLGLIADTSLTALCVMRQLDHIRDKWH